MKKKEEIKKKKTLEPLHPAQRLAEWNNTKIAIPPFYTHFLTPSSLLPSLFLPVLNDEEKNKTRHFFFPILCLKQRFIFCEILQIWHPQSVALRQIHWVYSLSDRVNDCLIRRQVARRVVRQADGSLHNRIAV